MAMPSKCPICGESKLVQVADRTLEFSGGYPVPFEVYECQSGKGQCAAHTELYVPKVGVSATGTADGTAAVVVDGTVVTQLPADTAEVDALKTEVDAKTAELEALKARVAAVVTGA